MFKVLPIAFALVIFGILGFAATKPDSFYIDRVLRMKAPPETIFPIISDFQNWQSWSPWVAKDPAIKVSLSDQTRGMGATYEWSGNKEVGEGRLEIVTELPPKSVRLRLAIFEPFTANNDVWFTLEPVGAYTKVTWHMAGPVSYVSKVFGLFNSMDDLVGPDLKLGLEKMKTLVEG